MTLRTLAAALAAGGLAAAAHAQPPAAPAAPATPQVIRYPGGVVVLNGTETIVRQAGTPGRSTNVVTGSGNGFGNRIVVDGGGGGLTVVSGSRNGVGNRLDLNPTDLLLDLDLDFPGLVLPRERCKQPAPQPPANPVPVVPPPAEVQLQPAAAAPAAADPPVVQGRNTPFWTSRSFSDAHDCNLYWHPGSRTWYRYHTDDDTYRPVPNPPAPPAAP